MDPARLRFLFGTDDPAFDVDDDDELTDFFASDLLRTSDDEDDGGAGANALRPRALMRMVVARQILSDEPPEAWHTVERLRSLGFEREDILRQMALAPHEFALALADQDDESDAAEVSDHYRATLEQLPLPAADDVVSAAHDVVAAEQGIPLARLRDEVPERLGRAGDELAQVIVDATIDDGLERGALIALPDDRVVDPVTLTQGIVLTHEYNESEEELEVLSWVGSDLGGFASYDDLWSSDDDHDLVEVFSLDAGHVGWSGPEGWLAGFAAGDLLAVRVGDNRRVRIERLDARPAVDDELVARLRRVYDRDIAETALPPLCSDLILDLLVDDPTTFDQPQLPVSELCQRAGLELRAGFVAHDDSLWRAQLRMLRANRVHDRFDDDDDDHDLAHEVLDLLDVADDPDATDHQLRRAMDRMHDQTVCWAVLDEIVDTDGGAPDEVTHARAFAQRLVDVAQRPTERMTAHWVAGIVEERAGDVLAADAHFHVALEADADWGPLVDRAAWYASDRGDARRAASLWRALEEPPPEELHTVDAFAHRAGAKRGRNDPCWCGSGRKLKVCHPGAAEPIPLPDRVGWICTKAAGYLERQGGEAAADILELTFARATDPDDRESVAQAITDPVVLDTALTEFGWFERFLRDRGPLLPDDEVLLATSWLLVDRTVYEIEDTVPGKSMVLRDVRTGERLDVRERTLSMQAEIGQMVCGRAVPDGVTHQFVGGVFPVPPGSAEHVLALCNEGDAVELCEHVAGLYRPPRLVTRESEPIVTCTLVLRVPDGEHACRVLDEAYEADGDGWVEMHELSDDERILRAQLTLDGDTLTVSTHSEPRVERVLAALRAAIRELEVVSDERVPLPPGEMPEFRPPPGAGAADPDDPAVREQIVDMMEQRWMRESVPALGGVTPLEAAADPTRRQDLERLLVSFPEPTGGPIFTLRPSRLRALLGLDGDPLPGTRG
jgi:hypothetical protein